MQYRSDTIRESNLHLYVQILQRLDNAPIQCPAHTIQSRLYHRRSIYFRSHI